MAVTRSLIFLCVIMSSLSKFNIRIPLFMFNLTWPEPVIRTDLKGNHYLEYLYLCLTSNMAETNMPYIPLCHYEFAK